VIGIEGCDQENGSFKTEFAVETDDRFEGGAELSASQSIISCPSGG